MRKRDPRMRDQAWWNAQIPLIWAESAKRRADIRDKPYVADKPYGPPPVDNTPCSWAELYGEWKAAFEIDRIFARLHGTGIVRFVRLCGGSDAR